jgi:membrane dipeptidase
MHRYPLLDTHVDLPQILRTMERRPLDGVDSMKGNLPGHVDIPKMKQGRLGGLFMTVYTPCPGMQGQDEGEDFTRPLDVSYGTRVGG